MDTTNEPVAWMMVNRENTSAYLTFEKPTIDMKISHEPTPLYTHPVKEKGLPRSSPSPMNQAYLTRSDNYISDEVIEQLAKQFGVVGLHEDAGLYEFARAILRKAQDK